MKNLFRLSRYHVILVFLLAGAFAMAFAYSSYNLFHISMANLNFLQQFGWMAVAEGALIQLLQIFVGGCFALFCYLGFKICESELLIRFRRWQDR